MQDVFRRNNFDLIRLAAAFQVLLVHSLEHLGLKDGAPRLDELLHLVPGVPIFFFLSGFLISRSYERSPTIGQYVQNRCFRIYPALIVCTLLSFAAVACTGYFADKSIGWLQPLAWIAGQMTFVQFYNPGFMRAFGTGVLNGSLWTITVELQFYVLVPLLYQGLRRLSPVWQQRSLLILIAAFCGFHVGFHTYTASSSEAMWYKLIMVSFAPWSYLFLIGVLYQRNFATVHRYLSKTAAVFVPVYCVLAYATVQTWGWSTGNFLHPALALVLTAAVFSVAYTLPDVSERLLSGQDLSYSLYIYHAPVLNLLMYYGLVERAEYVLAAAAITTALATGSWFLVERPCLRRKPSSPDSSVAIAGKIEPMAAPAGTAARSAA